MVWLLVISLLLWAWTVSRSPQVRKLWHTVFKSSIAMASAIILLFYLLFALLDSVHFRLATTTNESQSKTLQYGGITSLLDIMFSHNMKNTERTYSAPFATHEYTKSIVLNEHGVTKQEYLPLNMWAQGMTLSVSPYLQDLLGW